MSRLVVLLIFLIEDFTTGWPCLSPVRNVYTRLNNNASLQFTADLTNLNYPRRFSIKFYDGIDQARIRYNADRSYTTDARPGVTITGDTAGNVVVTLESVVQNNAGMYMISSIGFQFRCTCLYILGIPVTPAISVKQNPSIGGNVALACTSTSTTTPSNHSLSLIYNWNVDNVDNPSGTRFSYSVNRNTLTLTDIEENDNDLQFTCSATEDVIEGFTSRQSDSLSFRAIYGPENLDFSPNDTSYILYEYTNHSHVTCTATCNPPCRFKWSKIGQVSAVSNTSILNLAMLTRSEAGIYRCTAITPGGFSVSKELTINILSFSIDGHEGQKTVIADEHDADVQFTCILDLDISAPIRIMFNGEILEEAADHHIRSLTFRLPSVSCTQSGVYTCESGDLYQHIIMNMTLLVRCTPRPIRQIKRNITSTLNVPLTLQFQVIAYPEPGPRNFSWHKENDMIWTPLLSNEDLQIASNKLQTNLTIHNVSMEDFGRYRVTAVNAIGRYEQYMFLTEEGSVDIITKGCTDNIALIIGITLGIVSAALVIYSVCITIWVKRKMTEKGESWFHKTWIRKGHTYTNQVFIKDMDEPKPETSDAKDLQYTSLDDTPKEQNVAYETIHMAHK